MVHVSWSNPAGAVIGKNFLWRRIIRIVPLYWIGTVLTLGFHRLLATHRTQDSWRELVYSLSFIPYSGSDGKWSRPILAQGWTLSYEMMFYVVFALGLCAPRKFGVPMVCAALLALVLIGHQSNSATVVYLASPIVLWFLLGIALAVIWRYWEVSEPAWIGKLAQILEPIGDSSYSLYLFHGFVLILVLRVWIRFVGPPSLYLLPFNLAAAMVVGWVTYVMVERPLLELMNVRARMKEPSLSRLLPIWRKSPQLVDRT